MYFSGPASDEGGMLWQNATVIHDYVTELYFGLNNLDLFAGTIQLKYRFIIQKY